MATTKYTSEIKTIANNQETIYNFLSNMENLGKFITPEALSSVSEKMPKFNISNFAADQDSCHFTVSGFGDTGLRIINREPFKTIKIGGNGTVPFDFNLWIQLLPGGAYETKMRLTFQAELSVMMKMIVGKKLETGINKIADALVLIPYQ